MIVCLSNGRFKIINVDDYPTEKAYYRAAWLAKYGVTIPKQDLTKTIVEYAKGKLFSQ